MNPSRRVTIILLLCPLGTLVWAIWTYGIDIPYMDQWDVVYLFDKYYGHNLAFADLWRQHNEHRLLLPKLIFLGLGILTRYNVLIEMYTSVALALVIYLISIGHVFKHRIIFALQGHYQFFFILFAFFVFSPIQHENWIWGFQLQWFMTMLGVVAGMYIYSNREINAYSFFLLLLCALVSTFSLSSGILLWVTVFILLLIEAIKTKRPHLVVYILLWALLFLATIFLYFKSYETAPLQSDLFSFLTHPVTFLSYIVIYIGAPLKISGLGIKIPITLFWGLLGIFLYGLCSWKAIKRYPFDKLKPFLFFIGIGAFCILSAAVTAVGRWGFGPGHATMSRYTTVSIMFWLSLSFMLFVTFDWKAAIAWPPKEKSWRIGYTLVGVFFLILLFNSVYSFKYFKKANKNRACGQVSVLNENNGTCLRHLYPDTHRLVLRDIPILKKYHLSVFRLTKQKQKPSGAIDKRK